MAFNGCFKCLVQLTQVGPYSSYSHHFLIIIVFYCETDYVSGSLQREFARLRPNTSIQSQNFCIFDSRESHKIAGWEQY